MIWYDFFLLKKFDFILIVELVLLECEQPIGIVIVEPVFERGEPRLWFVIGIGTS